MKRRLILESICTIEAFLEDMHIMQNIRDSHRDTKEYSLLHKKSAKFNSNFVCSTYKKRPLCGLFLYVEHVRPYFILLCKSAPCGRLAAIRPLSLGVSLAPIRSNLTRPDFPHFSSSVLNNTTCRTKTAFLSEVLFLLFLRIISCL